MNSLLLEYFTIFGVAYYAYGLIGHAIHDQSVLGIIAAISLLVFLVRHYGKSALRSIGTILLHHAEMLGSFGRYILRLAEIVEDLFKPSKATTFTVRNRQIRSRDYAAFALTTSLLALFSAALWLGSERPAHQAKTERLRPPVPTLPFDKKWQDPSIQFGIGGPADDRPTILNHDDSATLQGAIPLPRPRPSLRRGP